MGRFRSSLEDLKPYPYASEIAISKYTKRNIHCVKVKSNDFFRELPLPLLISLLPLFAGSYRAYLS
jgi:hypothetical protein